MKKNRFVYWLVQKEKHPIVQFLALATFFTLFYFLFDSVESAIALILGMYFHELGHFVVFVKNKIKTLILLLFPLGAIAVPENEEENKKSDLLPWWNIASLLQAGYTVNVLLMILGVAMFSLGIWPALGKELVSMNGALAIFNLLPIWIIDGGQLFKVIFASLNEKFDRVVLVTGIALSAAILVAIFLSPISIGLHATLAALWKNGSLIIFIIIFCVGLITKHIQDNPDLSSSKQAMSVKQVLLQLVWYWAMVVTSLYLLSLPM